MPICRWAKFGCVQRAAAAGIIINIESEREVDVLVHLARMLSLRPRIAVRVNPDFELKSSGMKMGGGPKQFGVDAEQVPALLDEIGQRYSLIVFPEGGRGSGAEIGEFKSGLYYLCKKRPDLELVPVHIDNMNRILPKGEILPVPLLSCLSFGTPMHVGEEEPKKEFLEIARKAVNDLRPS